MTTLTTPTIQSTPDAPGRRRRIGKRRGSRASSIIARGEPMVWLTGGALAFCMMMIAGLLLLIFLRGTSTFWPVPVVRAELLDGSFRQGELVRDEKFVFTSEILATYSADLQESGKKFLGDRPSAETRRMLLRSGNFELTNTHYEWIYDFDIKPEGMTRPEWTMTIERLEWGRFFGEPAQFIVKHAREIPRGEQELADLLEFFRMHDYLIPDEMRDAVESALVEVQAEYESIRAKNSREFLQQHPATAGQSIYIVDADGEAVPLEPTGGNDIVTGVESETDAETREGLPIVDELWQVWTEPAQIQAAFNTQIDQLHDRRQAINVLERYELGEINARMEQGRLSLRQIEMDHNLNLTSLLDEADAARLEWSLAEEEIAGYREGQAQWSTRLGDDNPLISVSNTMIESLSTDLADAESRWKEIQNELREKVNGTTPAAIKTLEMLFNLQKEAYFDTQRVLTRVDELKRENARYEMRMRTAQQEDVTLSVADIVRAYPANQLDYFDRLGIYFSRWYEFLLDEPRESNSEGGVFPAIWGTLIMTVLMSLAVVPFGVLSALYLREYARKGLIVSMVRISINNLAGVPSIVFGVFGLGFFCYIIGASIDELFYSTSLPNPTFGKGALVWASFTLSLLTLPVVIVATEEALSAVPNSMREGSYACGAGKWQTIRRIVLPRALPGIMTGAILAMARGAGEVAPLMLVGAVKLAPELPVDAIAPFIHFERSFMHLGFHIYDLGFQSQNSEAAKPMVFTTTLLLIAMITLLNVAAIWIRGRLRRKFRVSQF